MEKRYKQGKSPWKKLRRHKPPFFYSLIILMVIELILSVALSFILPQVVELPISWQEFLKITEMPSVMPGEKEEGSYLMKRATPTPMPITQPVFVNLNYPSQIVLGTYEKVYIEVWVRNLEGPLQNERVTLQVFSAAIQVDVSAAESDTSGYVKFELPLLDANALDNIRGAITVREKRHSFEIEVIATKNFQPRDSDGDGLVDTLEFQIGSNHHLRDTDGDGVDDGTEYYYVETDPIQNNIVVIQIEETSELDIKSGIDQSKVIFTMVTGDKLDFFKVRQDEIYSYGFIEGYIMQKNIDENSELILPVGLRYPETLQTPTFRIDESSFYWEIMNEERPSQDGEEKLILIRIYVAIDTVSLGRTLAQEQ